ncbi:MAG: AI-2E family transporter [Oceanospirillaceae bacterium]|nr:AI-2E family transporter [Oceanospirillaceae bacterium]MCP5334185.1 AI-2E family transporter [Oceanospirillaceae bacterium]MCP5351457.1 AI-2E family transporter [Oceanospirillaceae bacterium]
MLKNNRFWIIAGLLLAVVVLILLLKPILPPFLLGILLAYLGDPIADRLERLGLSRSAAVTLCFTVLTLLFIILLLLLLPLLLHQIKVAYSHAPAMLDWLESVAGPWVAAQLGIDPQLLQFANLRQALMGDWASVQGALTLLLQNATRSVGGLLALLANMALVPVVSFYLLRDWDVLTAKIYRLLPVRYQGTVGRFMRESDEVVGAFLRGQLWVMLVLGCVYALGLSLVGLKLGLLVGLLAGLASIVPYLGIVVGLAAAGIAGVMQFGFDWHLLALGAVFVVGQLLEGTVLTPLLVGDKIGLHPVAVIFAIMAGGQLFGFVGLLLALPVAAVIMVLLRHVHEFYRDADA